MDLMIDVLESEREAVLTANDELHTFALLAELKKHRDGMNRSQGLIDRNRISNGMTDDQLMLNLDQDYPDLSVPPPGMGSQASMSCRNDFGYWSFQ